MNSVDMANNLIFRAKNLHEFTVTTEVPEDFRFNGVVPFDMSIVDNQIEAIDLTITKTKNLRSALLSDLLSGNHEIPTTYDKLIGAA